MKKITKLLMSLIVFAGMFNLCSAQVQIPPTYTLTAGNEVIVAPNRITFDIWIKHTNSDSTVFQYAGGQYFFEVNLGVANGGTLTYTFDSTSAGDSSSMPFNMRPRNPSIAANILRLAANSLPGAGNGFYVSDTGLGSKVIKLRLSTSASAFNDIIDSLQLLWHNALPNPFTKINAYTGLNGTVNTDVTTPSTHIIDFLVGIGNDPVSSTVIPSEFAISQNYPNPFNPTTKIEYALPQEGKVSIKVFDLTGREIAKLVNGELKPAGSYAVNFNGANLASGVYFYRIEVDGVKRFEATKRMVLIK
jgi:Secretion system C-terminal sorting domain